MNRCKLRSSDKLANWGLPQLCCILLGFMAITSSASGQCQIVKHLPDGGFHEWFGISSAISEDIAVVGALFDGQVASNAGAAYVYRFDGSIWIQEQKLLPNPPATGDRFGVSVAVDQQVIVVGAHFDNNNAGSTYVFRYDGSSWVFEQKLLPSFMHGGQLFGISVDIQADTIVVGAENTAKGGSSVGAAFIFTFDGASWIEQQQLMANDPEPGDDFGGSVALSGSNLVIGSTLDDDYGENSGSAYVFEFNGSDWIQSQKLSRADGAAGDEFGWTSDIDGNIIVVGSRFDDDNGGQSGSAYVYRFDGLMWSLDQKLLADDGDGSDNFGEDVAIDGETIVVTAKGDEPNGNNSGSAYIYRYDGSIWIQEAKIVPLDGHAQDKFGWSASIANGTILVGAIGDGDAGDSSGSTYFFDLEGEDCNANGVCDADDIEDGFSSDCNENGIPDECDIADATSQDENRNGIPDECEPSLDIKPGSCPNPLNRKSHGMMPAAILGTDFFDASQIDVSSVTLSRLDGIGESVSPNEGPPGPHSVLEDVGTPFSGELCDCHELQGDGVVDLSMHFSTQEVVEMLELNDLSPGSFVELTISGILLDKTPFTANDCIRLVPAGDMDGDGAVSATDLIIMFSNWGACAECIDCAADLDGNCYIDISDLLLLLTNWS